MSVDAPSCLIIGAEGFVGSAFVRQAGARGWRVVAGTRATLGKLRGRRFDVIVNANGNAKKFLARQDPELDYRATVESVRDSLGAFECGRYVLVSSVDVYSTPEDQATTRESAVIEPDALDTYGRHKLLAERAVMEEAPRWLILRAAQMLGPGLVKGPVFDLLHGRPLWVSPESSFHFLGTDRVAQIGLELAERQENECFNLCGKSPAPLTEAIQALALDPARLEFQARRHEHYAIDTRKLEALVPVPTSVSELRRYLADVRVGHA